MTEKPAWILRALGFDSERPKPDPDEPEVDSDGVPEEIPSLTQTQSVPTAKPTTPSSSSRS